MSEIKLSKIYRRTRREQNIKSCMQLTMAYRAENVLQSVVTDSAMYAFKDKKTDIDSVVMSLYH